MLIGIAVTLPVCAQDKLVDANNEFAFTIYEATKPDVANFMISPFSLHMALSVANEAAGSTTRKEMDRLLCIRDASQKSDHP